MFSPTATCVRIHCSAAQSTARRPIPDANHSTSAHVQLAQQPLPLRCSLYGGSPAPTATSSRRTSQGGAAPRLQQRGFRCHAQRDVDWDTDKQRIPDAPPALPIRMPSPPPPPPPPPPPGSQSVLGQFGRRPVLLAIMFGGAALMSAVVRRDDPQIYMTDNGVMIARTAGGAPVATFADENGNIFMIDPNGNLYYDTGDPALGVYFVDPNGTMLNIFVDGNGDPQYVPIGNIKDLRIVDVNAIGGVPIADLEKAYDKQKTKRLYAFPSQDGVPLPDNAPAIVGKDGTVQPPPMLEEGALLLERKEQWWPFGSPDDDGGKFKRGM